MFVAGARRVENAQLATELLQLRSPGLGRLGDLRVGMVATLIRSSIVAEHHTQLFARIVDVLAAERVTLSMSVGSL